MIKIKSIEKSISLITREINKDVDNFGSDEQGLLIEAMDILNILVSMLKERRR